MGMHIDGDEALARPGATGGDVNAEAMIAPESWTTEPDGLYPSANMPTHCPILNVIPAEAGTHITAPQPRGGLDGSRPPPG
jgi:hypothetical protein